MRSEHKRGKKTSRTQCSTLTVTIHGTIGVDVSQYQLHAQFPKVRNCDICLRTKVTRSSCRRRTSTVALRAEKFGDLVTADHKVLSEVESRHNHRCAVVVQDLATQWIQSYPCKTKNFSGSTKELADFLGAAQETIKSFTLTVRWNLARTVRINLESLYVNTAQIGNEGSRKSSAQSERRDICGVVAIRSGQKMVGRIHSTECHLRNIQDLCLMGRHFTRSGSATHLKDQLSRMEQWSNITLFLLKTYRDYINVVQEVLQGIFLGYDLERIHDVRRH